MKKIISRLFVASLMVLSVVSYRGIRTQIQHYDKVQDQKIGRPPEVQSGWGREVNGVSTNAAIQKPKLLSHYRDPNEI